MARATPTISPNPSSTHYLDGDVAKYTCEAGYELLPENNNELVCNGSGSWHGGPLGACYTGCYKLVLKFNKQPIKTFKSVVVIQLFEFFIN